MLGPWYVRFCFLNHSSLALLSSFAKAYHVPSAMGFIWCTFCSSLWVVGDFCRSLPEVLSIIIFFPDIYYLAFSKDPLTRKIFVYAVYATELVQTILFSKVAFDEFASGFGNFVALESIGNLWFACPILTVVGMFFLGCYRFYLFTSNFSGIRGPNVLRISNQIISTVLFDPNSGCFGKHSLMHLEYYCSYIS